MTIFKVTECYDERPSVTLKYFLHEKDAKLYASECQFRDVVPITVLESYSSEDIKKKALAKLTQIERKALNLE